MFLQCRQWSQGNPTLCNHQNFINYRCSRDAAAAADDDDDDERDLYNVIQWKDLKMLNIF